MKRQSHTAEIATLTVDPRPVLITGGAGFIGTNLAHRLLSLGQRVIIYDNLSRNGAESNLQWLKSQHGNLLEFEIADVRNREAITRSVCSASKTFHFAAQVAFKASMKDPISDFEVNCYGTLNILEAIRHSGRKIPLVFASSNKVYGPLNDVELTSDRLRYKPREQNFKSFGINETRPLQLQNPYSCSRGAAEQYVLDYAHTFKTPTVVLRMSCIYGPHQCGTDDQGWIAHFLTKAIKDQPITIYGDGKQVRDILYIDDLVDALLLAQKKLQDISGEALNIGGGATNTISLLELLQTIGHLQGKKPQIEFDVWRRGDQRYYVSDNTKFQRFSGWSPKVTSSEGIEKLYHWLLEAHGLTLPLGKLAV